MQLQRLYQQIAVISHSNINNDLDLLLITSLICQRFFVPNEDMPSFITGCCLDIICDILLKSSNWLYIYVQKTLFLYFFLWCITKVSPLRISILHIRNAIMPGHGHIFRGTIPKSPIENEDLFLNWCCPVKDKDTDIEQVLVR